MYQITFIWSSTTTRKIVILCSFVRDFCYNHRIIEKQNLRYGINLGRLPIPISLQKHFSRAGCTAKWSNLNISREENFTSSLDTSFLCSVTLKAKKLFLMFRLNYLCSNLCLLPLVLSLGTTTKNLAPSSWHLSIRLL